MRLLELLCARPWKLQGAEGRRKTIRWTPSWLCVALGYWWTLLGDSVEQAEPLDNISGEGGSPVA